MKAPAALRRLAAASALLACASVPAPAAEVELALGHDGVFDSPDKAGFAVGLGLATDPLAAIGPVALGLGAGLETDEHGDAWAGGGVTVTWPPETALRLRASVMAGAYVEGRGSDLGSALQFRTRLGADHAFGPTPWRVGLAMEHKSNANLGDYNPGIETVFVTLSRSF